MIDSMNLPCELFSNENVANRKSLDGRHVLDGRPHRDRARHA
jgi:hypothetical protein